MASDDGGGWRTVADVDLFASPKPPREPVEVELWGGPFDGAREKVYDVSAPLTRPFRPNADAAFETVLYRARPLTADADPREPIWFDFQPLGSVAA